MKLGNAILGGLAFLLVSCSVREDILLEKLGTFDLRQVIDERSPNPVLPFLAENGSFLVALKPKTGVMVFGEADNLTTLTNAALKEVDNLLLGRDRVILTTLQDHPLTLKWVEWLVKEKRLVTLASWKTKKVSTNDEELSSLQIKDQVITKKNSVVTLLSDNSVVMLSRDLTVSVFELPEEWTRLSNIGNYYQKKIVLSPVENEVTVVDFQVSKRGVEGVRFKNLDYVKKKLLSQVLYEPRDMYFLDLYQNEAWFTSTSDRDAGIKIENFGVFSSRRSGGRQLSLEGRQIGSIHKSGSDLHGYTLESGLLTLWALK